MEIKDLLPLIGVIFGWVLSELSKYFRERGSDKKLINRIIAELLFLRYEISQFNSFAKGALEVYGSGPAAEKERQRVMDKHLISVDKISNSYDEMFKDIASYDPILAKNIVHQITTLRKMKEIKFDEMAKVPDFYEAMLSSVIEVHKKANDYIEKLALKLSLKISLLLWLRMKYEFKKNINSLDKWGQSFNKNKKILEDMGYDLKIKG